MLSSLDKPILTVTCNEPKLGDIERNVYLCQLSVEKLRYFYEKLSPFRILFNNFVKDDIDSFIKSFVDIKPDGTIDSKGLIWEIDDVGIVFLTNIVPGFKADIHTTFWDQRLRGREPVAKALIKYIMTTFQLVRLQAEVPIYASAILRAVERVGFVQEGKLRKAAILEGRYYPMVIFSITDEDI